jgi:uncharacterized SAM-binding protein YcdF (DUF218 family)
VRTAIVIPGSGGVGRDGVYRIGRRCLAVLREAEHVAARTPGLELVVLSGWSPLGGQSEAEQMRAAWRGPDVELVVEPTAAVTAENAARTLPLLVDRGVERALVVCTPLHFYRARFFFTRVYRSAGIETRFWIAPILPSPAALLWELGALPARRAQLRAAKAELLRERTP